MNSKIWILGAAVALGLSACGPTESTPSTSSTSEPTETSGSTTAATTPAESTPAEPVAATETAAPDLSPEAIAKRAPKDGEEVGVLNTTQGRIVLMFFPDVAPNHVARFKECLTKGVYSGTYFHRVIPGFMIQGGDPNTKNDTKADDGGGGYGSMLKGEFNAIKHVPGILSAARTQNPDSAQSQFFIVEGEASFLDNQYTAYGKVVEGMDVVKKIVNLPRDKGDNPNKSDDARIKTATLEKWPVKK